MDVGLNTVVAWYYPGYVGYRSDAEKVSSVQRLVKAYQEEIDVLVKRCRVSDSAFFSLYKSFYEAPDPAKALERLAYDRPRAAASEVKEGLDVVDVEVSKQILNVHVLLLICLICRCYKFGIDFMFWCGRLTNFFQHWSWRFKRVLSYSYPKL